jgi:short subunit dehydrogenase-like uncharacterized protein
VGPFVRWGDPPVEEAIRKGAHYLDSNGEPPFNRRVFERYGPRAVEAGIGLLTAFGWESVLGNLAGALALHEAGEAAVRVDTGYFHTGLLRFSPGTRASLAGAMALPSFAFRDGAIRTVRGGDRYRTMPVEGRQRPGVALGATEHFTLPRTFPRLREVNAYVGWFGRLSRPLHAMSRAGFAALRVPGVRSLYEAAARRYVKGSRGGPDADERARGGVHVVGMAYDPRGTQLAEVHLSGIEGYDFTARILAWGADRVATGGLDRAGALGPIEAFGIGEIEAGCREAGVTRVEERG